MSHVKLFIPGPVEVSAAINEAMAAPMIGHRSKDFQSLYQDIQPRLKTMFGASGGVFLSTSSAWGIMEGALRNLVSKGVLTCCCGAFSDKWFDVARRCGKSAEALRVEWGDPIRASQIDEALASGRFDAVTLVHNETSTGVLNPLEEIAGLKRKYPEVMFIVDTVSSFSVVPVEFDRLGLDVMLTGSQKALALPPGLSLFAVSEAAMERASQLEDRGYYFDFQEFAANHAKNMTPSTPCISLIHGLRAKLDEIFAEGLDNRYRRHATLNDLVHDWVNNAGFEFFAAEGYRSRSLTCVANNREIDVPKLQKLMRENHRIAIDGGYGKIKGTTFRLSNMGDETEETLQTLLGALDDSLARLS